MGLNDNTNKKFMRKPYIGSDYRWSPNSSDKSNFKSLVDNRYFCNTKDLVNGEDFITTYVYNSVFDTKQVEHRYAYVVCDYVQ